jgi:uncharacterized protein YbcI
MDAISTPSTDPRGSLDLLTNALVRLHKDRCGRGPERSQTHVAGDVCVCVMRGGLTTSEHTLLKNGDHDAVGAHRAQLHESMREEAIAIVERELGRGVQGMLSSADPAAEAEVLVFLLAPVAS